MAKDQEDEHNQGQERDIVKTTEEDTMVVEEDIIIPLMEAQGIKCMGMNSAWQEIE